MDPSAGPSCGHGHHLHGDHRHSWRGRGQGGCDHACLDAPEDGLDALIPYRRCFRDGGDGIVGLDALEDGFSALVPGRPYFRSGGGRRRTVPNPPLPFRLIPCELGKGPLPVTPRKGPSIWRRFREHVLERRRSNEGEPGRLGRRQRRQWERGEVATTFYRLSGPPLSDS
jgi:hypothetical protein